MTEVFRVKPVAFRQEEKKTQKINSAVSLWILLLNKSEIFQGEKVDYELGQNIWSPCLGYKSVNYTLGRRPLAALS